MNKFLAALAVTVALLLPLSSAAQNQHSDNDRRVDQNYGDHDRWQSRLSPEDQSRFDSYYSRWLTARQSGDRKEISSAEKRMRDVMGHYSIPPNVQFSEIASDSVARYRGPQIPRFSGDDANDFRSLLALAELQTKQQPPTVCEHGRADAENYVCSQRPR